MKLAQYVRPYVNKNDSEAETALRPGVRRGLRPDGKPSQAVSQSNPTTLRSTRLNSTPIRWTERPRWRYLSA